jgi:hypothetical protein
VFPPPGPDDDDKPTLDEIRRLSRELFELTRKPEGEAGSSQQEFRDDPEGGMLRMHFFKAAKGYGPWFYYRYDWSTKNWKNVG